MEFVEQLRPAIEVRCLAEELGSAAGLAYWDPAAKKMDVEWRTGRVRV